MFFGAPDICYADAEDGEVAYQIIGNGPDDLIFVPSWESSLEVIWEDPAISKFLHRLASFSRLIVFDKRGTGVSSPLPLNALPTLEQWTDDVLTVLDAARSPRAVVFGQGAGGAMALLFAATHPERTSALVLLDAQACFIRDADYVAGLPQSSVEKFMAPFRPGWGSGEFAKLFAPQADQDALKRYARLQRTSMSPLMATRAFRSVVVESDVRSALPAIRVPTLVLHRRDNQLVRFAHGQYLAQHIDGARFVAVKGDEHLYWLGETDTVLDSVEQFASGRLQAPSDERVLATVVFTDIVESTRRAAAMGDLLWREVLDSHDSLAAQEVEAFRGRLVKSTGDGLLATFDGPTRAVRATQSLRARMTEVGLPIRAGLHAGEIELRRGDIGGISVHIASRIAALANSGEILTSRTLKDLTAGSGLNFIDRGHHALKGLPDEWQVYAVA